MAKKRVIVTGGAGFIGSHLCRFLLDKGYRVICIDNFLTGRKQNIAEMMQDPDFLLVKHDINKPMSISAEQIYNLACPASPKAYQENAIDTIKTNTIGTINMLELAKTNGARILQASTSEVYGDPTEHPQKESYWGNVNPIGLRSCYDEGKRVAECLCMNYHRRHQVDIRIVRIFNTYGPNMDPDDGRVVSNFMMQALSQKPITINGSGRQTRSFLYISDLVEGLHRMMEQENIIGPVNMGNPQEVSIRELAELIISKTGSRSEIVNGRLPDDDPVRRKPDITLAKEKLSWEPKIALSEGLSKSMPYFKGCVKSKTN